MAERTMEELLRAPTEGYGEAIVLPEINADHFEIKTNLLQLVQANPFYGRESENPHAHINSFKRITSTLRFRNVPNDVIKLMMFPYSLKGAAKTWSRESKPRIRSGIGGIFGPNLLFSGAWKRFKELLRLVPIRILRIKSIEIVSKKVVTPAPVKAVEETCVTCGGAHSWYNCPANDNNQTSVCATTGTYNQVNPPNRVSNQMAPPGFAPVQNNGCKTMVKIGFQNQHIQVLDNQVQQEFLNEFSSYKRTNDQMMRNMQNQINSLKGEVKNEIQNTMKTQQAVLMNQQNVFQTNLQNMLSGFFQNQASTSGTLPSNTIPNPKGEMKAITTRSGVAYEGPSIPTNPSPKKEFAYDKEKLLELAKIPLNENCSAMLLKKLPKKLGDPGNRTRVPLILGRSFLRTGRALIDVYGEEITLRVDNEAVTFNLDQTTRYSSTNDKSVNRIDIIDAVCEEYSPELLGFSNSPSGNPTPTSKPFTSEFILEEIEAYLKDDSISPEIDHANCNPEEDICLIEKLLNNDSFKLPPMDLKQNEVTEAKSSIEEPLELELKDLPSHLEYAFLEENDKLPVIIAKGLKNDEKDALLKVLKSHKWAIAWKITDIKGIDPCFCTYKILMEDDYKPTVQSQRRVNPKIHEVMIYPISDSPWVSPVHCVPKKGGITVVANEENELILTCLVTGWRVCIDYRKLNEATRKYHFPLTFMDQMIEILAGNEFYCFLDGFLGYFQIPIDPQD
ncbi:hypothetical protein Tco_1111264 [Tanacetum coccineum]|uniref:Reverse transcriptase domain-containing protein n=1 Tax=Tanacetum coccineum TaxID=301880 RepID=A0ABQ5IL44_9ASTR